MIQIEEVEHSLMGPSSFARVEKCTASAILAEGGEPSPASEWAFEGTICHWVAIKCLTERHLVTDFVGEVFVQGTSTQVFDVALVDHVQYVVDYVRRFTGEKTYEARLEMPGGLVWGYADCLVVDRPYVNIDFKFGAGVEVSASIVQTGIYLLMFIISRHGVDHLRAGDPREVLGNSVVLQPRGRGEPVKPWPWSRAALLDLYLRVAATANDVRERRIRYHVSEACRWCPVVTSCPELRAAASGAARVDPSSMTLQQVDEAVKLLPAIDLWVRELGKRVQQLLEGGHQLQSAKLVQKRATRKWKSEAAALEALRHLLQDPYQDRQLLTPNMAEQRLPKDKRHLTWADDEAGLVESVSSGLTWAHADDKRPAVLLDGRKAKLDAALRQQTARAILGRQLRGSVKG